MGEIGENAPSEANFGETMSIVEPQDLGRGNPSQKLQSTAIRCN